MIQLAASTPTGMGAGAVRLAAVAVADHRRPVGIVPPDLLSIGVVEASDPLLSQSPLNPFPIFRRPVKTHWRRHRSRSRAHRSQARRPTSRNRVAPQDYDNSAKLKGRGEKPAAAKTLARVAARRRE